MKIGFFTDRFYPQVDGVAVSTDVFARELIKLGHEVVIFCPQSADKKQKDPNYVVRFRSIPSFWYEGHRDTMPFNSKNVDLIKSYDFDLVHIQTPAQIGVLGMRVARENNIPIVITHHTDLDQYTRVYKKVMLGVLLGIMLTPALVKSSNHYKDILKKLKPKKNIKNWNRKLIIESIGILYNNCDAVIVPSEKMQKSLKDYGYKKNAHILPTGIDLNEAKLGKDIDIRATFGIDKHAPLLLFVGRLGVEKNIQLIIKSMPRILAENPDAVLLIVGDGPYAEDLRQLASSLGVEKNIKFAGMQKRDVAFASFAGSDIFCFASLTDTQGLVLNEAGIKSKPIVFVDEGISPLAQDGVTGIKTKNTAASFAKACNKLINDKDLAEKYGKKANQIAHTITIQKQAEKLLKIYKELV